MPQQKVLPEQTSVKVYKIPGDNPPADTKEFKEVKHDHYSVTTTRPLEISDPNVRLIRQSVRGEPMLVILTYHAGKLRNVMNLSDWDPEASFKLEKATD